MKPDATKKVFVIGTQHLDVAWLWTRVPHGEDLMRMVLELALDLVAKNPDSKFIMSRSTPWGYSIVEQQHPKLFAEVQKAVAAGSIELSGGQWVEPDNLIPSGEAHLRQCLYGQLYYLSRFGKMASVAWDPDVFGHGNTLPQIFGTCGLGGYYFHRALPANERGEPVRQFIWQAPDGTEILCFAGGWIERPDAEAVTGVLESNGQSLPLDVVVAGRRSDRRMTIRPEWLDLPAVVKQELGLKECRWATADDVLTEMETYRDQLPVFKGDLGGYTMTGTYTSDQITKRFNRKLENDLATAEFVNTLALLAGGTYYSAILADAWRDLCLNQFHDIACGTCYRVAQEEAHALYRTIEERCTSAQGMASTEAAAAIKTDSQDGVPVVVFNPLSTSRTDPVTVPGTAPPMTGGTAPTQVVTSDGEPVLSQTVGPPDSQSIVFTPKPVPSCGHEVYFLQDAPDETRPNDTELVLENDHVRVEFDISYGSVSSIYDKTLGFEFVKDGTLANRIVTYEDKNDYPSEADIMWDPWFIRYTGSQFDPHGAYTVYVKESGPVRKTICVQRSMLVGPDNPLTVINQDITLYANSPLITVRMYGDWQAEQACVKSEFDLSFAADSVVCDMPYGVIEQPSVYPTTTAVGAEATEDRVAKGSERAEYDRPMQMWIDFSDGDKGIAFLNNGKYGYDSTDEQIRLTLMRAPFIRRGEIAGLGPFEFSYGILPHAGTWRDAELPARGYEFNRPLVPLTTWRHDGAVEPRSSWFSVSDPSVLITAVKKAEQSGAVVLRLYESGGTDKEITLTCRQPIRTAFRANGLELPDEAGTAEKTSGHQVRLKIRGFEVATVVVECD